ncbi:MAG: 16S rRNA (uracil(1498)-N(3))-methyltransferase [Flavobacteriales bacterium]|jgi:16S rRNA (uracil1498-N3)-methyltransferase|nr:16S rRNA (uracil(1498)-N(3))-methyltransferase [Flavobacteriales bacterium]
MRFFYAPNVDAVHFLDPSESKHVVRVLRAKIGDRIGLLDGRGNRYAGVLTQADKHCCVVETSLEESQPATEFPLTLVIAPTKSTDRFEWLLEKAMEYGVRKIQPVWTERSERKTEKSERWEKILVSALKQSKQLWLTELAPAVPWLDWLNSQEAKIGDGFVAHCESTEKTHLFDAVSTTAPCWVAIGPEGDFTAAEIDAALAKGALAVTLGEQRLRTETAGLAAIQVHALSHR